MTDASVTEKAASALDTAASATADTARTASAAVGDAAASTGAAAAKAADATVEAATRTAAKAGDAVASTTSSKAAKPAAGEKPAAKPAPPQRSMSEIEAELDATRARLSGRIDDLQSYVAPRNIADRQIAKVKGVFVDEYGGIKPDRVLIAVGVVAALVGVSLLRRRRG